ncbi:MAG: hypothetical protein JO235_22930 [Chroococcidiopsidaceae cyanobacterium CP_BM_RX_35]|nr:hypothetical protein [Chroococcidiopsidaceae cyanobacterium CP_BM_RX_35]
MNQVISWLQSIRLRQILTAFLVTLIFFVSTAFDRYGNEFQAKAEPVTPEAVNYKLDRTNSQKSTQGFAGGSSGDSRAQAQDKGKNLFENIREKLNLDKPSEPGTKQTFKQIQNKTSEAANAPKDRA